VCSSDLENFVPSVALARIGDVSVKSKLIEVINTDEDTDVRVWAMWGLCAIANVGDKELIRKLSMHDAPDLRRGALLSLAILAPRGSEKQKDFVLESWRQVEMC